MKIYQVQELQNAYSHRATEQFEAKSETAAKREASSRQMFHGTVLYLKDADGWNIARKENGSWKPVNERGLAPRDEYQYWG